VRAWQYDETREKDRAVLEIQAAPPQAVPAGDIEGCTIATKERSIPMSVGTILLIVLIVVLIAALPAWPYSTAWGYGPSGIAGLIALVLLILLLTGRL
jgi:hypothetical protein